MIDETGIETGFGMCQERLLSEEKGRWEIQIEAGPEDEKGKSRKSTDMPFVRLLFYSTGWSFWEAGRTEWSDIIHEQIKLKRITGGRIG